MFMNKSKTQKSELLKPKHSFEETHLRKQKTNSKEVKFLVWENLTRIPKKTLEYT